MRAWLKRFRSGDWLTVQRVGIMLLTFALVSGVAGYAIEHPEGFSLQQFAGDFYANVSTELTSIAITVLIIDTLNRRREQRLEEHRQREQLTRQLGSSVNEVAKRAAEELRANGWLTDGSLQGADLRVAHLEEAKLWRADLQGVNLQWAKLKKANLNDSILVGANLMQANLQAARLRGADLRSANLFEARLYRVNFNSAYLREANLEGAHLEGARLEGADLRNAVLAGAYLDELTILPDATHWTPETDLARFTNPAHPEFWQLPAPQPLPGEDFGDE